MGTLMAYEEYASIVGGIVEVIQLRTKAEAVVIVSFLYTTLSHTFRKKWYQLVKTTSIILPT